MQEKIPLYNKLIMDAWCNDAFVQRMSTTSGKLILDQMKKLLPPIWSKEKSIMSTYGSNLSALPTVSQLRTQKISTEWPMPVQIIMIVFPTNSYIPRWGSLCTVMALISIISIYKKWN